MKNLFKQLLTLALPVLCSVNSYCQRPPEPFIQGLNILTTSPEKAKLLFYESIKLDSTFSGSYNFLGILLSGEKKYDSAIYYLENAIRLNKENVNHTREMTLVRLARNYLYKHDFSNSFRVASAALKAFPDNPVINSELKDVCLWSYNTKYAELSTDYLSPDLKSEYLVNTVSQEYLIMRNIKVDEHNLIFTGQAFDSKNKMDILTCMINKTKDTATLKFKLNWDMMKDFGGKYYNYKTVYEDKTIDLWFRLGAKLSDDSKITLLSEMEKLSKN